MDTIPDPVIEIVDDAPKVIVLSVVLSAVALLFVIGRIYSRRRNMRLDDWAMMLAMVSKFFD